MGIKKIPFFDFSAVLDKLQAIADNVHPTASGTSITPTGMHIVTEDDVQGAISELDTAVDSVNASLTQLIEVITITDVSTDTNGNYVTSYDWVDGKYIPGYSYQSPGSGTGRWFMTIRPSAGNKIVCHAFADDNSRINRNDVCFVFYKINN